MKYLFLRLYGQTVIDSIAIPVTSEVVGEIDLRLTVAQAITESYQENAPQLMTWPFGHIKCYGYDSFITGELDENEELIAEMPANLVPLEDLYVEWSNIEVAARSPCSSLKNYPVFNFTLEADSEVWTTIFGGDLIRSLKTEIERNEQ